MEIYRRDQFGRMLAGLFVLGFVLAMAGAVLKNGPGNGLLADRGFLLAEALICLAFFILTHMTVRVTDTFVEARFGRGLLKKRVPLENIESVDKTLTPWHSPGIKRIRRGWAWTVAPGPALDIRLTDSRVVRIGTDDPEGLLEALDKASGKSFRIPS